MPPRHPGCHSRITLPGFDSTGTVQLFQGGLCYGSIMKTFLKVLFIAALLIVAIKLSPMIFVGSMLGLLVAAALGVLGLSLLAILCSVLIAITVALAPIWIPFLVVMGLISLFRRKEPKIVTA